MTASKELWFEDVVVGTEMRSATHIVSAEAIAQFCDLTQDHHPLHTDAAYAKSRVS